MQRLRGFGVCISSNSSRGRSETYVLNRPPINADTTLKLNISTLAGRYRTRISRLYLFDQLHTMDVNIVWLFMAFHKTAASDGCNAWKDEWHPWWLTDSAIIRLKFYLALLLAGLEPTEESKALGDQTFGTTSSVGPHEGFEVKFGRHTLRSTSKTPTKASVVQENHLCLSWAIQASFYLPSFWSNEFSSLLKCSTTNTRCAAESTYGTDFSRRLITYVSSVVLNYDSERHCSQRIAVGRHGPAIPLGLAETNRLTQWATVMQ